MADAFDPKGKTFKQRLDAFIADVKSVYSIIIRTDQGRTAEWQQKHHVAHMFLYNSYKSTKPAKTEPGKRTISWSHFADPKVTWDTIKWSDFLRTKNSVVPHKEGTSWKKGLEPEQAATEKHVQSMQVSAGIGNGGKAMVSAGLKPCGEPCKCGAGRSNHLAGLAADLNSTDLTSLTTTMTKKKAGDLDAYLKKFGLHRPLLNHPTSPEKWHVEAIQDSKL